MPLPSTATTGVEATLEAVPDAGTELFAGAAVRVRFVLSDADLYSYQFDGRE